MSFESQVLLICVGAAFAGGGVFVAFIFWVREKLQEERAKKQPGKDEPLQ